MGMVILDSKCHVFDTYVGIVVQDILFCFTFSI